MTDVTFTKEELDELAAFARSNAVSKLFRQGEQVLAMAWADENDPAARERLWVMARAVKRIQTAIVTNVQTGRIDAYNRELASRRAFRVEPPAVQPFDAMS